MRPSPEIELTSADIAAEAALDPRVPAPLPLNREGWRQVRFGDVVSNVNVNTRSAEDDGYDRYVGLDHIAPEDLRVKRWGNIADGTTFTRVFRAGQVLFGKRRAYQRKVAVPDFDGICSGDILVFEAKADVLFPDLLPFIVQSEGFFQHALGTSAGSLSPRTKWNELANYSFALPSMDVQRQISDILWANTNDLYCREAVIECALSVKESLLGDFLTLHGKQNQRHRCDALLKEMPRNGLSPSKDNSGVGKCSLSIGCVQNGLVQTEGFTKVAQFDPSQADRFAPKQNDVLIVRGNGNRELTGLAGIVQDDLTKYVFPDLLIRVFFDETKIKTQFAVMQWNAKVTHRRLLSHAKSTNGIWKINGQDIKQHELVVPPLEEQNAFLSKIAEVDASIVAATTSLTASRTLKSQLSESLLAWEYK